MRDQTLGGTPKLRVLAYLSWILDSVRSQTEEMVSLALHRTQAAVLPSDPLLLIRQHGVFLERELVFRVYAIMSIHHPNLTSHRSGGKSLTVVSSEVRKNG
jgi:hypothetical protein